MEWHEAYELPPFGNMMLPGPRARENFIEAGNRISSDIADAVAKLGGFNSTLRVLDFGCGVGRVAMPLHYNYSLPTDCCDVSAWCINLVKRQIPKANPIVTKSLPPLPYEDNAFDLIYSISVWTHLPLDLQWPWLREVNRVLKMGGYALISTSGYQALKYRREVRVQEGWAGISDNDLKLEGCIYKGCDIKNHDGVKGSYGYVAHDPDWLKANWGRLFQYVDFAPAGINRIQDLNVLRKVRQVSPSDLTLLDQYRG